MNESVCPTCTYDPAIPWKTLFMEILPNLTSLHLECHTGLVRDFSGGWGLLDEDYYQCPTCHRYFHHKHDEQWEGPGISEYDSIHLVKNEDVEKAKLAREKRLQQENTEAN